MKAIVLAAGKGTRVRPLTNTLPKVMLPILNRPIMELLIGHLAKHGFDEIMINTSYLAREIETSLKDGSQFGVSIGYSFEGKLVGGQLVDAPLGSAGALRKIQDHSGFFDETFLVICGDALVDLDLTELVRRHKESKSIASIALAQVPRDQVSSYGVVVTGPDGRIREFQEKPPVEKAKSTTVNTGIYIFEPAVMDLIPSGRAFDIGGELFPLLVQKGLPFHGFHLPFEWLDVGQLKDFYRISMDALKGRVRQVPPPGREVAPGVRVGLNVHLDPKKCKLTPPICIAGSATIEDGATLEGPVWIGQGSRVESGASVRRSLVFDYTRIGGGAEVVEQMVCGTYCVDSQGNTVDVGQADLSWLIADSRTDKPELTPDQALLLDTLRSLPPAD